MEEKEKLSGQEDLSISELLDMLVSDPTNEGIRKFIEKKISENYELKPFIRCKKSLENLDKQLIPLELRSFIEPTRTCARIIIERLGDFSDINSISQIETIVNHQIGLTKNLMTINSFSKD